MKLHSLVHFGIGKGVNVTYARLFGLDSAEMKKDRKAIGLTNCLSVFLLEILAFVEAVLVCRYGLNVRR